MIQIIYFKIRSVASEEHLISLINLTNEVKVEEEKVDFNVDVDSHEEEDQYMAFSQHKSDRFRVSPHKVKGR